MGALQPLITSAVESVLALQEVSEPGTGQALGVWRTAAATS